ncbi:glycosyltransferase family 4 protein [Alienimonas sp. DA493]|uniref:glycosyltransferase family 4 protein n=1 Tax=Alienimonas sp. DA493 TaxID=3373605 RepID=UPI0037541C5D
MSGSPPRRVLHVVQTWADGGTERYVADLGTYLATETPWTPELCVVRAAPPAPAAASAFAAVERVSNAWRLVDLLRRTQPAVVHLHLYTALLPAALTCRAAGTRPLVHLHQPLSAWNARHRLAWQAAVRLAGHVTAGSTAVLTGAGFLSDNPAATRVPAPVTVPRPAPPRPPTDPLRPFVIAGVGRLSAEKDWPTLLRALPRVIAEAGGRAVRFVHAGGGERAAQFHAVVRELGLTEVVDARGPVPHATIAAILDAADLFVLPSRFEGLGIAPLEAMARGVPVLVADFPAADDYILGPPGEETGHTFPRGDANACADRILWHLRNPGESAAVGRRGRIFAAERFTPAATFGMLPAIYETLATDAPAAARNSSADSVRRNR